MLTVLVITKITVYVINPGKYLVWYNTKVLTAAISKAITQNGEFISRGKVNLAVHQLTEKQQSHGSVTAGSKRKQKSLRTTVNVPAYRVWSAPFIPGWKVGCPVVLVLR